MLRRFILSFLLLTVFVLTSTGVAMASEEPEMLVPVETAASALKSPTTSQKHGVQLTDLRWANSVDPTSGQQTLRMVLDLTGPVKAEAKILRSPDPKLVIQVNTLGSSKVSSKKLDGQIAKQVRVATGVLTSQLVVDLPKLVSAKDYRIFTLPADEGNKKKDRLVIDILKPGTDMTKTTISNSTTNQAKPISHPVTTTVKQVTPIKQVTPVVEQPPREYTFTAGLRNKVIVLDPGHGGSDPGAIGPNRIMEKDVTLPIALKVKEMLERAGAKVYMTRTTDVDVFGPDASAVDELSARVAVGVNHQADLFLSIHANSFSSPAAIGAATYYFDKSNYDNMLAQEVEKAYVRATDLDDRGVYQEGFYVVKHSPMPAALIELAFISNPREEKILSDSVYQKKAAQGIVQGIESFFNRAAREGGKS